MVFRWFGIHILHFVDPALQDNYWISNSNTNLFLMQHRPKFTSRWNSTLALAQLVQYGYLNFINMEPRNNVGNARKIYLLFKFRLKHYIMKYN